MEHSACFIGHRTVCDTPDLRAKIRQTVCRLIESGTVVFLFGDHSDFNALCFAEVTEQKKRYPQIKRIQFRCRYPHPDAYTKRFLSSGYDESIFSIGAENAGKAGYIKRNQALIDESETCVFYFDTAYSPLPTARNPRPKSGTAIAYAYAIRKNKSIVNLFDK